MKNIIKIAITIIACIVFSLMFLPFISFFFKFLAVLIDYIWTESIELLQALIQMW